MTRETKGGVTKQSQDSRSGRKKEKGGKSQCTEGAMASTAPVWNCSVTGDSEGKSRHVKPSLWIDVISHRRCGSQSTSYCSKFRAPSEAKSHG